MYTIFSCSWIMYSAGTLDETLEAIFIQWLFTPIEDQDTDLINKMIRKFQVFAEYFSKFMTNREFICGNRYEYSLVVSYMGRAMWKSSSICGQRSPRSDCAYTQSDLGLRCPLLESLYNIECMHGEQRQGWDLVHAHDDVNLHILRMLQDTFSLGTAQMMSKARNWPITINPQGIISSCAFLPSDQGYFQNHWILYNILMNREGPDVQADLGLCELLPLHRQIQQITNWLYFS